MKKLVTAYSWDGEKIITQEITKLSINTMPGWRLEPEETLFAKVENNRYCLENELYDLKQRIEQIYKLEKELKRMGYNSLSIKEKYNPYGISIESIEEVISLLNNFKNKYVIE